MEAPQYDYGLDLDEPVEELEDLNVDIELGAVNDLQGDLEETEAADPTQVSTSQHKWHPHTVKVMKVLRQALDDKVRSTAVAVFNAQGLMHCCCV